MRTCQEYYGELREFRHWLHRHPELSMEEEETSCFLLEHLQKWGIPCRRTGKTGVIADIQVNPQWKTVAIRSEIDGLPIQEQTGCSFASVYPGKMHACGHDAITAVNLCLAKALWENRSALSCNVRFLFEPGEETGEGAAYMMAHGALKNPEVREILIFHFANQESRSMEIQKSITTAAIGGITISVRGKSSHWFQPKEGIDALYAASRLAVEIRRLNETLQTEYPFVLGFGQMSAGTAGNIVAGEAVLKGSLRAFAEQDFSYVWQQLKNTIRQIEEETGADICLEMKKKIPPMINDAELVKRGAAIGRKLLQEKFSLGEKPFLVGDNAALYMEQIPGMRVVFLAGKEDEKNYPVHNPGFDIEESSMEDALEFLYEMVTGEFA